MAGPPQQAPRQSRLAIHNRQRPRQAEKTVPSVRVTRATSCPPDVTELVLCPSAAGTRTKRVRPQSIRTRWTQEQQWQAPSAWGPPPRHSLSRLGEVSPVCPKGDWLRGLGSPTSEENS